MDVYKGTICLIILLQCLHEIQGRVNIGVTITSYTNVNGTAYVESSSTRRCCDGAQRADCATGDTCDTYLYICFSASVGPGWSCRNGASFQTKVFNNTNIIKNVPEMTAVSENWQPGMTLFAIIRDDDTTGLLQANDHIDTLTQAVTFQPDTSKLDAKRYNFQWMGRTSLIISVRAWCAPDYYGSNCDIHCQSLSPVATCDANGYLFCQQEGILLLEFIQQVTKDQKPQLILSLNQFFAEQVCHSKNASIHYPQLNVNSNTMTFTGYCGNQEVYSEQLEDLLATSQASMLRHYFSPGVKQSTGSSVQGYGEHITPNVRVSIDIIDVNHTSGTSHVGYDTNSTVKCCDTTSTQNCGMLADTCDMQFTICLGKLENSRCVGTVMMSRVFMDTLVMHECGPTLIDHTQGNAYPVHPMIGAFHLAKRREIVSLQVIVKDSDNATDNSDVIDILGSDVSVTPSPDLLSANTTDVTMKNTVAMTLRLMFWCAPGHSGPDCSPDNGTEHCQQGWQGDDCDVATNSCTPNPCNNGGKCQMNTTNHFNCTCTPGYQGPTCDTDVDECLLNICKNGATCQNLPGAFNCICTDGWDGLICTQKTPHCNPSPCLNSGHCISRPGMPDLYVCQCTTGWIGRNCEKRLDCSSQTCVHGNCTHESSDIFCVCDPGYRGDNCTEDIDECEAHPCENGGSCKNTFGSYNCSCQSGYYGKRCENKTAMCAKVTCQNNGTCVEARLNLLGFKCFCRHGYTGRTCESLINPCQNVTCENGGNCVNNENYNGFHCNCSKYWTGQICDIDINECNSGKCVHSLGCNNTQGSYHCSCQSGWNGQNCDQDINECTHSPCNNGQCSNTPGSFKCTCNSGHTGIYCNMTAAHCVGNPCNGHGSCYGVGNTFACKCTNGYTGSHCETDINECQLRVCSSNSLNCTNLPGSYNCTCKPGWAGTNCTSEINECVEMGIHCGGNGMCMNTVGSYYCQCFGGFTGANCENFVNSCDNFKCGNNGSCKVSVDGPKCACLHGWTGITCGQDVNECETDMPCHRHGKCVNTDGGFYCDCAGWTGSTCQTDVNECMTSVCKNKGVCANQPGGYTCGCQSGWLGMSCEIKQLNQLTGYIMQFHFESNITSDKKQPIISYLYDFLTNNVCKGLSTQMLIRSVLNNVMNFTATCGGTSVTKATIDTALDSVSRRSIFLLPLSNVKQMGMSSPNTATLQHPNKKSWPVILGVTLGVVFIGAAIAGIFFARRKRLTKESDAGFNNPTFTPESMVLN